LGITGIRETMSSDKATSFDTSGSTEWEGEWLLAVQKSKFRKSEPFREQYKRYVRTSRPSLQSLIIYVIIMYAILSI
jgi:hypothetical protein